MFVSENIGPVPVAETTDALTILEETSRVSANLFQPLDAARIDGSRYGLKASLFSDEADFTARSTSRTPDGFRQSFKVEWQTRTVRRGLALSVWERLLPLLEPPVSFEFPPELFLPAPLYPYQCTGVKFLAERASALLADEMGTGKTVETVVALRFLFQQGKIRSALIVAPVSVLRNWDDELERWAPSLTPTVVRGSSDQRKTQWDRPAHIWMTSYGTIRSDIELLGPRNSFDVVILDEIQAIKNADSGQSRAAKQIARVRSWGLSGTPVENSLDDLSSIFEFLSPGLLRRERLTPATAISLIRPYFLRRRKKDVLDQLPEKKAFPRWVILEDRQRQAYDNAEREGRVWLGELGQEVTITHVLQLLQRLKMLCNRDPESGESAKFAALKEDLEDIVASGSKALVFSQYLAEGVRFIQAQLAQYAPATLVGDMSLAARQREVQRFQNDDTCKILVATPKTGGIGLNLVAGNYVFHFDHWWNPATGAQAEDRVHRIGQTKDVFVYHLWTANTVEERIRSILERKRQLFEDVIDAQSNLDGSGLSEKELFELFDLTPPRRPKKDDINRQPAPDAPRANVLECSPEEFENLVGKLYERLGFHVRRTATSRDGGVDLIASRARAGEGLEKYAIQCKRYQPHNLVGVEEARALLGVLTRQPEFTKGILVTTSDFTSDCRIFCNGQGRVELINGGRLSEWLRQAGLA